MAGHHTGPVITPGRSSPPAGHHHGRSSPLSGHHHGRSSPGRSPPERRSPPATHWPAPTPCPRRCPPLIGATRHCGVDGHSARADSPGPRGTPRRPPSTLRERSSPPVAKPPAQPAKPLTQALKHRPQPARRGPPTSETSYASVEASTPAGEAWTPSQRSLGRTRCGPRPQPAKHPVHPLKPRSRAAKHTSWQRRLMTGGEDCYLRCPT